MVEVLRAEALKERTIEFINIGLSAAENLSLKYDYISKDASIKKLWASERHSDTVEDITAERTRPFRPNVNAEM